MLIQKDLLNKLIELASDSAEYLNSGDHWITVKPHGEDSKGTHVLVKDGETNKEAVERKFDSKTKEKKEVKRPKEGDTFTDEYGKKQYVLWDADDNKIHYASDPEAPFGNVMSFEDYKELISNPEEVLAKNKKSIKDFEDRIKAKKEDLNDVFDMTTSETNKEMKGQWHINDFAKKHNIKVEDVRHFRDNNGIWITAKLKNARKGYKEYAMLSK